MFLNCPAGVHGVPQAYLHETGWFIQDFGATGHGGWLPEPVSFQPPDSQDWKEDVHVCKRLSLLKPNWGLFFQNVTKHKFLIPVGAVRRRGFCALLFPRPSSKGLVCISSALCGCSGLWFLFSGGVCCILKRLCVNPGWLGRPLKEHDLPPLYLLSLTVLVSPPFAGRIFLSSSSVPEPEAWGSTWQLQTRWGPSPSAHHIYQIAFPQLEAMRTASNIVWTRRHLALNSLTLIWTLWSFD